MGKGGGGLLGLGLSLAFGPAVGMAMGLEGAAAGAIGGGLVGGATSALTGGNFAQGAVGGALGGWGAMPGAGTGLVAGGGLPTAVASAADPIEAIWAASEAAGGVGATTAAQAMGYGSVNSMLGAVNPAWLSPGVGMMSGASNALNNLGMSDAASMVGGFSPSPASLLSNIGMGPVNPGQAPSSSPLGPTGQLMTIGSGAYGLWKSKQLQDQLAAMAAGADPFGPYRGMYAQQLAALTSDPSTLANTPGYQAGLQAVQRSMMAQGYGGSGNMMTALQNYGGKFYNDQVAQLSNLAGVGFGPGTAGQLALGGAQAGLTGQLSSLGLMTAGLRGTGW